MSTLWHLLSLFSTITNIQLILFGLLKLVREANVIDLGEQKNRRIQRRFSKQFLDILG